jgi:hypothetical protein
VKSPFATDAASYGTTQRLTEAGTAGGKRYRFEYGNRGPGTTTGEMTKYTLPYGGAVRWVHRDLCRSAHRAGDRAEIPRGNTGRRGDAAHLGP